MKLINEIYLDMLKDVWENGVESKPHNQKVKELLAYKVECNPYDNVITIPSLSTNVTYANEELNWYLSGSNKFNFSPKINKIWEKFSDDGMTVNSAYGYYIFNHGYMNKYVHNSRFVNQWHWCKSKLLKDSDTRQAVININSIHHKNKFDTKDFPCTLSLQFFIRDSKLILFVNMRSNDIYFGFRNDMYCFTELQKRMAEQLNLQCGKYIHIPNSLHLYEEQFYKVKKVLSR